MKQQSHKEKILQEFAKIVWRYRIGLMDGNRPKKVDPRCEMDDFILNLVDNVEKRVRDEILESLPKEECGVVTLSYVRSLIRK